MPDELPYANLESIRTNGSRLMLELDPGSTCIMVRIYKPGTPAQKEILHLNDLHQLAYFIDALLSRYNWLVRCVNRTAATIRTPSVLEELQAKQKIG